MRLFLRVLVAMVLAGGIAFAIVAWRRLERVDRASAEIPMYPGARAGGGHVRYWPRFLAWDDRSAARVDRVFALPGTTRLLVVARHAHDTLASLGWYLVMPEDLRETVTDPQVVVWQRDPDERLDLTHLWPIAGMTPAQRMYGDAMPAEFLDAPTVVGWSWTLDGPRSARPVSRGKAIVGPPPPPIQ